MVVSIIAMLAGILLPAIGKARDNAQVNVSKNNLRQMAVAHKIYAADWADRHLTFVRDTLGQYGGNPNTYTEAVYAGHSGPFSGHPPIIGGWAYGYGGYIAYGIWPFNENAIYFQPMNFPGPPNICGSCAAWGWFRFGHQCRPFHDYLDGKYHDPVYFAPKDHLILDLNEPCFALSGEFVAYPTHCNNLYSSYCMSPAGLFSPTVFSDNGQGEHWTAPWELPSGYKVPSFAQVRYPTLKTHMLEHQWLQNSNVACNVSFVPPPWGPTCEPYYFNHSFQSTPVTLFYDGSVRMMSVLEAMSSDRRAERQTGYGLWSRDTPFGEDGYLIADGYDFAASSFHILTIDGVRGRDTIGKE